MLNVDVGICIVLYCTQGVGVCFICQCGFIYCMFFYVICGCMCFDVKCVYVYMVEEKKRNWVLIGCGNQFSMGTKEQRQ